MERTAGIGGIFFRARDAKALAAWYAEHLGVQVEPSFGGCIFAAREGDQTVWSPFAADSTHFPLTQAFMINYRVPDLHAMLAQLRAAGVKVDEKVDESEFGKFGWASDPEGNRFELWQPPA